MSSMPNRFIYNGPFDASMPDHYLIINDILWWINNESEIYEWMEQNLPRGHLHHQGMCIVIPKSRDAVMFMLRWGT